MADRSSKLPVPSAKSSSGPPQERQTLDWLGSEIDRLFEDFGGGFLQGSLLGTAPLPGSQSIFPSMPAIDVRETDKAYEITAEFPGMDDKSVEVKVANGLLSIACKKQDERREENKDYYLRTRNFSSFQRTFPIPDDVDVDRIEAAFKNGVLSVTLPKSAAPQTAAKRIGKSFEI
jgi:HSP20 family protein